MTASATISFIHRGITSPLATGSPIFSQFDLQPYLFQLVADIDNIANLVGQFAGTAMNNIRSHPFSLHSSRIVGLRHFRTILRRAGNLQNYHSNGVKSSKLRTTGRRNPGKENTGPQKTAWSGTGHSCRQGGRSYTTEGVGQGIARFSLPRHTYGACSGGSSW